MANGFLIPAKPSHIHQPIGMSAQAVYRVIKDHGESVITQDFICAQTDLTKSAVKHAIVGMVKRGNIEQIGNRAGSKFRVLRPLGHRPPTTPVNTSAAEGQIIDGVKITVCPPRWAEGARKTQYDCSFGCVVCGGWAALGLTEHLPLPPMTETLERYGCHPQLLR